MQLQLFFQFRAWLIAIFQNHEYLNVFAFYLIWLPNCGSFCHGGMAYQARFDLHRTQTMTTDFDNIVDAPLYTQVTFIVDRGGITGEINVRNGIPISLITGWIAIDCAHLAR